jgi:RNA polymerase sigma-70 factor, ECF subfamily
MTAATPTRAPGCWRSRRTCCAATGRPSAAIWRRGRAQAGTPQHEALPDGLAAELITALDALAPGDREALLLYAWGELSYEEIARAMNTPVGTVRSRIARARGRLSACLEDSHA